MYLGNFASKEDVIREYSAPAGALDGAEVLFAYYSYKDYEGDSFVLFRKDNKLYEVNGSHCSCYGLEGQWDPEETSVAALRKRAPHFAYRDEEFRLHLAQVLNNLDLA